MQLLKKSAIAVTFAAAALFTVNASANGGTLPPQPHHSVFLGVGGGFSNTQFDHCFHLNANISGFNVFNLNTEFEDHADDLAPTVQLGIMFPGHGNHGDWFWGFKGVYSFLNSHTDSGNINSVWRTKFDHLFSLLVMAGTHVNADNTFTIGVGPAVGDLSQELDFNFSVPPIPFGAGTHVDESETVWGVTGEVGFQHYFDPNWFLDANYSYSYMGREDLNYPLTRVGVGGGRTLAINVSDDVRVISQQVMVTLNRKFV